MKKQILEALKAKFEGVSDAVLNRIADKLAKTVTKEEDVTTSVEGVTIQQVLDSYGDSRATEASQNAVTNYEKKHNLKDGNKVQQSGGAPDPKDEPNPDPTDIAGIIQKAITPLVNEINSLKAGNVAKTRKQILEEKLANVNPKLKAKALKDFDKMDFKDEEEFNAHVEETIADLGEFIKEENENNLGGFGKPMQGAGDTKTVASKEEVADIVNAIM